MTVTAELVLDERMGWKTYQVEVDGHSFIGVTEATGKEAVDKFVELCKANEKELLETILQVDKDRQWNLDHPGKGKFWPSMKKLDKFRNSWCKQAGIVDS